MVRQIYKWMFLNWIKPSFPFIFATRARATRALADRFCYAIIERRDSVGNKQGYLEKSNCLKSEREALDVQRAFPRAY